MGYADLGRLAYVRIAISRGRGRRSFASCAPMAIQPGSAKRHPARSHNATFASAGAGRCSGCAGSPRPDTSVQGGERASVRPRQRALGIEMTEIAAAATMLYLVASRASRSALRCSGVLLFVRLHVGSP